MASDIGLNLSNVNITSLTVKDGKVEDIGMSAPAWWYFEFAQKLMERAADAIPHQQRPLKRKIDTVLSKIGNLCDDLREHKQYCIDLEERKRERHEDAEFNKLMRSATGREAMARIMGSDLL